MLKIKKLFYGLLTIPLLIPLLQNNVLGNYTLTGEGEGYEFWGMTNYLIDNNGNFLNSVTNQNQYLVYYGDWGLNSIYNWSWYDGKFTNQTLAQGVVGFYNYYSGYFLCDYQTNCWTAGNTTHLDSIDNFYQLDLLGKIDSVSIYDANNFNNWNGGGVLCFDSSELNNSYCFPSGWYGQTFGDISAQGFIGDPIDSDFVVGNGGDYTTFLNKVQTIYGDSPFMGGGGGGGGNNYIKLPMCYTIQQKIDTFPSNYNTGMCYSTNKIWSGNQFITVTPKSMLELRPTYQEYENDVNLYQNYCGNYVANNTACTEAFSGNEDKRSIINKLYNQGTQTILRSYDYCYLQLSFTEEQKNTRTNCTMGTGLQHGSGITTDEIIEDMENHRITIITPDGTTVYSGFRNNDDVEEEANLSYDGIIETMQSIRGKLTNIFYYRSGVTGIIPDYITRILLLIVLFAIFKK